MRINKITQLSFIFALCVIFLSFSAQGQNDAKKDKKKQKNDGVRTMVIPISIFSKKELKERQPSEFLEAGTLTVKEDGDDQVILSIRSDESTPLSIAFLIQENIQSTFNLELKILGDFIKRLPTGSRVMIGYIRNGNLQIRQKFTEDLGKAVGALRIIPGSLSSSPDSPFDAVKETLERFDALPAGRRAIIMFSDGFSGLDSASPSQNLLLDKAIFRAQRKSVAIHTFHYRSDLTTNTISTISLNSQGSLQRLSDETGGRAFIQGISPPVSIEPYLRDLSFVLNRQLVLSYLSTHMKKGYHRIQIISTYPDIKIEHPKGYYYR